MGNSRLYPISQALGFYGSADAAGYKQTVLTAFAQAEDYIAELRVTSQQLNRQEAALSSAQTYVTLETGRYETGLDPYPNLITARLTLLSSEEARVTLRMNELTEAVELIQSLGGGWNISQLPSPESIRRCGVVQQVKDGP